MLPLLNPITKKQDMQTEFRGIYNHPAANSAYTVDECGLTAEEYPVLTQRKKTHLIRSAGSLTAISGGEKIAWAQDNKLYVDGEKVMNLPKGSTQLIRMGAYIVCMPDKLIYNTHTKEITRMEQTNKVTDGVHVRPCTLTGADVKYVAQDRAPENPYTDMYWWDTAHKAMYQYLGGKWTGIDTVYTKLEGVGISIGIKEFDVVSISGFTDDNYNLSSATVYGASEYGEYLIVVTGAVNDFTEGTEEKPITVTRSVPDMDYMTECGNRLWGCSNAKHEVYASKLGDPTNWNSFLGISTDSYAATVGSEGKFTGCATYLGYVMFFKEDRIHRVYGTRPENFNIVELPVRGVMDGCEKSICVCNETLYYYNRSGLCAFGGDQPQGVMEMLGDVRFHDVRCGADDGVLYMSVKDENNNGITYTLDTTKGIWHIPFKEYCDDYARSVFGLIAIKNEQMILLRGGKTDIDDKLIADDENAFEWYAEFGDAGLESPNKKKIKKLMVRLELEPGARVRIEMKTDSDKEFKTMMNVETLDMKTMTLPLRFIRCDHLRLRISGYGKSRIYGISKIYEQGSERACSSFHR